MRRRIVPTNEIPIIRDAETLFGKEVIIFDNENTDAEMNTASAKSASSISMPSESEDWAGSPLKFEFFSLSKMMKGADWSGKRIYTMATSNEYFGCNPMRTEEAMEKRYRPGHSEDSNVSHIQTPAIFFTDAKDPLSTAFISIAFEKNHIVTTHSRFLGKFGDEAQKKLLVMSHRFKKLLFTSKATAVYNFLSTPASERRYIGSYPSEMSMKFTWTNNITPTSCLTTPASSSKVIIRCSPGWKDPRVSLFEETCILEQLLCMAQTLRDGVPMIWPKNEDKNETVLPRVQELIEQSSVDNQNPMSHRFFDFTEQLFDILRFCTSSDTLVAALRLVFNALMANKINTITHADNKSTLARLIRDSNAGDLNLPRLEAMTVIQILLEIGIERFRRDMIHTFMQQNLVVNADEFKMQYVEQRGAPEDRALQMLPLHLALVTIMELTKYLNMGDHSLSLLRKRVLNEYTARPIETVKGPFFFETSVAFTEVDPNALKCVKPSLWMNEVIYSSKAGAPPVARTIAHFTRDLRLAHLEDLANSDVVKEEAMETDAAPTPESQYVCTLITASYNKNLEMYN